MIKIADHTDLMPHLFALSDQFVRCEHQADVEIWPAAIANEIIEPSDTFAIFVNQEHDMHTAEVTHEHVRRLRPNNLFAVTAFGNEQHRWPFPVVEFWSNVYYTFRNNPGPVPLDVEPKPYDGCALFGGWEFGRAQMFEQLQRHGLVEQCLVNLQPKWTDAGRFTPDQTAQHTYYRSELIPKLDVPEFIQSAYTPDGLNTMPQLATSRHSFVSQKIPHALHNQCYVSIVAETEYFPWRDTVFLTEKIAKPLIVGQPFLVYSAPGTLKYLKAHGLKTFDPWIDETYDSVPLEQRAKAIIRSFKKFATQSADVKLQMLVEMQTVCKHNQALVTDPAFLLAPIVNAILQKFKL